MHGCFHHIVEGSDPEGIIDHEIVPIVGETTAQKQQSCEKYT